MATFNFPNGYTRYVSVFGSDSNNGSKDAPYRTLQKARDAGGGNVYVGPGFYRENPNFGVIQISTTYNVYINSFLLSSTFTDTGTSATKTFTNLKLFYAYLSMQYSGNGIVSNSYLKLCTFNYWFDIINTVIHSCSSNNAGGSVNAINFQKSTFYKCTFITNNNGIYASSLNNIFHTCYIAITLDTPIRYWNFYNCSFKIGNESSYTALTGATDADKLANLRSRWTAKFPTSVNTFEGCIVSDPLFNNVEADDFTLQATSPARYAAFDGSYVGAKDIAYPTYAYANNLGHPNSFYNASKSSANIVVADGSITLARNVDGSAVSGGNITEKPKDLGAVSELKGNGLSFLYADRNREMPNYSPAYNLSAPISAGTALVSGNIYINEIGAITYNSTVYPIRSRIYSIDTNTFTTTEGGVLYLVTETVSYNTNLIRFKQTIAGTSIYAGTNLTANSWYIVYGDTITWSSLTIPIGDSFQAIAGQLSFTGSGYVKEIFNDSNAWNEIIINAPIKCRRVGNTLLGQIDVGTDGKLLLNGHAEYYNSSNIARAEFDIFARYTQMKHYLSIAEPL